MTTSPGPCYRFAAPAQRALLFEAGLAETLIVDPASGADGGAIAGCRVSAFALSPSGDLFWVDERGRLLADGCDVLSVGFGGSEGGVVRLVAGRKRVWVLGRGANRRLVQLDAATFHLLLDLDGQALTDIASDGKDGLWLLAGQRIAHLGERGGTPVPCPDLEQPASQIAATGNMLAALTEDGMRLFVREASSDRALSLDLAALLGDGWTGKAVVLSGADGAFLLTWAVETPEDSVHRFVLIDSGGNIEIRGEWRDNRAPVLLAISGGDLLAVFEEGGGQVLKRFRGLARRGGRRRLTPALETERPEGRWLRADVFTTLPEGATLAMRWAATADQSLRRTVETVLDDEELTGSARLERIEDLLTWSDTFTYVGAARDPSAHDPIAPETFALPLHAADGPVLWVDLQLRGNGAPVEPGFQSLVVFHEADSLMDNLPAIYSGDGDRDGTMRRLVGVLEATTQDADQRIGRLADRLDPRRTDTKWLPDLAAMLGLPFHDALSAKMQRGLVSKAPEILAGRGTRDGLLAMLNALFPDRPIRVVDRTEQLIPLALNSGGRLPALLAGASIRVPKLNARLVLSKTALCPADACTSSLIAPPPQVLVVIPATSRERRLYAQALTAMIEAMLPAGVRLRLNWTIWTGAGGAVPGDVLAIIGSPEPLALGAGPALGRARTGGRRLARLDGGGVVPGEHRLL